MTSNVVTVVTGVIVAPMPSGVEHSLYQAQLLDHLEVIVAPMPSGVEHWTLFRGAIRRASSDRRADAFGR